MNILQKLYGWYGKKTVISVILVVILLLIVGLSISEPDEATDESKRLPAVKVTTPANYSDPGTLSLIGTVRAFTEAQITSEVGGRVTSVNATLGQQVQSGSILITLENASERAFLLQAEGAYEAAEAAAASGNVGTKAAEISLNDSQLALASANDSAYGTFQNSLFSTIDTLYSNPNGLYPGLRISTEVDNSFLRSERVDFQTILTKWSNLDFSKNDVELQRSNTNFVVTQIKRLLYITDVFITAVNSSKNTTSISSSEKELLNASLTNARNQLVAAQGNIESRFAAYESAKQNLDRAIIGATGGTTSAADAQLKQALGNLRAAQANLAKTILRSPISGTINSLSVKSGDFIGSFEKLAVVANNSALEIVTFVGDNERNSLNIGDTVLIEGKYEGVVTEIAPAVDNLTKKTEVRIATESSEIKNGDTVKITNSTRATSTLSEIRVPLTAVKFEIEDGYIFTLEENKLKSVPVELGSISGNSVVIESGLTENDQFVIDARGLIEGTEVEISN